MNNINEVIGRSGSGGMNQGKGFVISILAHLLIIAMVVQTTSNIPSAPKLMVVDFSILESPVQTRAIKQVERPQVPPTPPVVKPPEKIEPPPLPKPVLEKKVVKKIPKSLPVKKIKIAEIKPKVVQLVKAEPEPLPEPEVVSPVPPAIEQEPLLAQIKSVEPESKHFPDFPAPAAGRAMENNDETKVSRYTKAQFSHIQQGIQRQINYPRTARKMGWEGKVVVEFIICKDGTVKNIHIVESSGFEALDKNAVATIKKSAPFPIPPIPAKLIIPVVYRLS